MRAHAIAGLRLRAGSAPPSPSLPISGCPIGCVGTSPPLRPTQRYVGDITYLPLADGSNLYLATVIDCFSRRLTQPMGVVGTSADNALAETFNASLKRETLQGAHAWPDPATCRRAVFGRVNRYNTHRRHSYCGQQAPIVYKQQLVSFPATEASHQRQLDR